MCTTNDHDDKHAMIITRKHPIPYSIKPVSTPNGTKLVKSLRTYLPLGFTSWRPMSWPSYSDGILTWIRLGPSRVLLLVRAVRRTKWMRLVIRMGLRILVNPRKKKNHTLHRTRTAQARAYPAPVQVRAYVRSTYHLPLVYHHHHHPPRPWLNRTMYTGLRVQPSNSVWVGRIQVQVRVNLGSHRTSNHQDDEDLVGCREMTEKTKTWVNNECSLCPNQPYHHLPSNTLPPLCHLNLLHHRTTTHRSIAHSPSLPPTTTLTATTVGKGTKTCLLPSILAYHCPILNLRLWLAWPM